MAEGGGGGARLNIQYVALRTCEAAQLEHQV